MHVRAQLRAAAVALLAALPATAGRVYPSRLRPLRDADLPCLLVHTDDEEIAVLDIGGDVLERRLRLVVRACVKTAGALDDALDALIAEVEAGLAGQTFGGLAKSVEAWREGELAGGLYGIDLGHVFTGESMFSLVSGASKAAFVALVDKLRTENYRLLDCQVHNHHLQLLGAFEISRDIFLTALKG